jgi:hypothetical protein
MEAMSEEEHMSLVERKRQEAFSLVLDEFEKRIENGIGPSFSSHGREYPLTSTEDCMVAYAQMMQSEIAMLHKEVVSKGEYREEQATAKLLELFSMYERLIALYTELRSYYPKAASRIEAHVPSLTEIVVHGDSLWAEVQKNSD